MAVKAATSIFTSPELKDLRGDWLSVGRDVTLRVLKEAWGPMFRESPPSSPSGSIRRRSGVTSGLPVDIVPALSLTLIPAVPTRPGGRHRPHRRRPRTGPGTDRETAATRAGSH